MDLKKNIENRISILTTRPRCNQERAVLCLWDDEIDLSEKVSEGFLEGYDYTFFSDENTFPEQIKKQMAEYKKQREKGLLLCPKGIYVLVMLSKNNLLNISEFKNEIYKLVSEQFDKNTIIEFAVRLNENTSAVECGEEHVWFLEDPYKGVDFLLENAMYCEETFYEEARREFADSTRFILKLNETNSVCLDMCYKYWRDVEAQKETELTGEMQVELDKVLFPGEFRSEICWEMPTIDWLPLVGYYKLEEKLHKSFFRAFVDLISRNNDKEYTVKEIIDILYDSQGAIARTEAFRAELQNGALRDIADRFFERKKEIIDNRIKENFTVYDIKASLQNILIDRDTRNYQQLEELEEDVALQLNAGFKRKKGRMDVVLTGLDAYRKAFDDFCRKYLEHCWWKALIKHSEYLRQEGEQVYREFTMAGNVLTNAMLPFDPRNPKYSMSFYNDKIGRKRVTSISDLVERISVFAGNNIFNDEDMTKIIKVYDSVSFKADDNVSQKLRPVVFMIVSENMEVTPIDPNELTLKWVILKHCNIPKQKTLQVRVYRVG